MNLDDDITALADQLLSRGAHAKAKPNRDVIADNLQRVARQPTPSAGVPMLIPLETSSSIARSTEAISELSVALVAELAKNSAPPDPRELPARFSSLKHFADSPLHYKHHVQFGRDDTLCMRIGRGAHALVLGQPIIEFPHERRGKRWARFQAEHAGEEILNAKEYRTAMGIYDAVTSHRDASQILFGDDAVLEETIHWTFLGKACTSRPDSRRGTRVLTDLKTTRCARPDWFKRDAVHRLYHSQMSYYRQAMTETFGSAPDDVFCVAVESKAPHAVTVLELKPALLRDGEKNWRLWFEQLLQCERANVWPAYTEIIEPFDAPEDDGDVRLTIGGKEFSFDGDDVDGVEPDEDDLP